MRLVNTKNGSRSDPQTATARPFHAGISSLKSGITWRVEVSMQLTYRRVMLLSFVLVGCTESQSTLEVGVHRSAVEHYDLGTYYDLALPPRRWWARLRGR